ncbi:MULTISPECIES: ArsC/Spx/MgsR family protein [unclassified Sulfitobacter]|uniref:ArsC/Spx/MgsR family protein n=1 Tax=unclassified Sulfitobacter TaxID=196795 RepID=UPI0007C30710|nr:MULTISPECIES: ArsC/Spx/MgsR family protein [unclassified Sulfitobacter]KZY00652.1 arsenate reductase [Sulfitobacter sp. HI0023]KZY27561.1 arsenate reductase [Sulfitobacter sp. HI0040]KZZ64530.1 arsenate reductase [Sulfitobacter sp. HI0129]MBO27669.1 arsenate reductase [Paracoccaceae bacterium]
MDERRIYGLKNCDSCRKAVKALPEFALVDVREEGVPDTVLARAHDKFGQALINTRSTTWRGLAEAVKVGDPLTLLKEHPAIMKRPLIDADGKLFLSWNSEIEEEVKASL